jgi:hypothetical protein
MSEKKQVGPYGGLLLVVWAALCGGTVVVVLGYLLGA